MKPLRTTIAVVAALAGLLALAAPAAHGAAAVPTVVQPFTPLTTTGTLSSAFTITARYSDANCVSGSPTTGSTYECTTPDSGQGIYEACWVSAQTSYVICLPTPWSRKVTQLHVTRAYDDVDGFTRATRPWGIRLAAGQRCLLDLDATSTSGGHANRYFCAYKMVLVEPIDRSHPVWRALAYRRLGHDRVRWLGWKPIALVWRTQPSALDTATPPAG